MTRRSWAAPALVVGVAVLAVFAPALRNGFVLWDDDLNLTENPRFRGLSPRHLAWMFSTVHGGHYQPLTWLTFGVDHALWGMDPAGYHLTSIVLHACAAVLCAMLIAALLEPIDPRPSPGAVLAGALFFAVHPLRVEAVAWASERRDVLSGLFYLATVLAYVRFVRARQAGRPWSGWLAMSLVCFVLSLLAEAWGMTLPVVLLILDAYPLGRLSSTSTESRARVLAEKLPWAVLALGTAIVAFVAQRRVPAMRPLAEHGVLERVAQAAYGLCFYVAKTIVPLALSPAYLLEPKLDPSRPLYLGCLIAVLAVTTAGVLLRHRAPWVLASWLCYVAVVSPVLGFVQTGPQIAADRYSYVACVPWVVLLAAGLQAIIARPRSLTRTAGLGAIASVLVVLAVLAFQQTRTWKDSETLWTHVLRVDPTNHIAYTNRGWARQAAGDAAGALADYDAALRAFPGYFVALTDRGVLRQSRGDLEGALADYDAAIAANPRHCDAWFSRGTARHARGDVAGALEDYDRAVSCAPDDPRYVNNRGWARQAHGDLAGAAADYTRALELTPSGMPGREMIERNLSAVQARVGGR